MADIGTAIVIAVLTGAMSAGATVAAIKVELRWHRRDIDDAHKRLTVLEASRLGGAHVGFDNAGVIRK